MVKGWAFRGEGLLGEFVMCGCNERLGALMSVEQGFRLVFGTECRE